MSSAGGRRYFLGPIPLSVFFLFSFFSFCFLERALSLVRSRRQGGVGGFFLEDWYSSGCLLHFTSASSFMVSANGGRFGTVSHFCGPVGDHRSRKPNICTLLAGPCGGFFFSSPQCFINTAY